MSKPRLRKYLFTHMVGKMTADIETWALEFLILCISCSITFSLGNPFNGGEHLVILKPRKLPGEDRIAEERIEEVEEE